MLDTLVHRWLRVPYTLNVRVNRRPKTARTTVLFLHGIGNTGDAWGEVIAKLPLDIGVITIDLLGFGNSPKPEWAIYNARRQAASVLATYLRLRLAGQVIVVGHSLGSLVAIEIAKRYPLLVKRLILCAPPFYRQDDPMLRLPPHPDAALRRLYNQVEKYPDQFIILAKFAMKYQLVNKSFSVTPDNLHAYIGTLRAAILNQTALDDAMKLRMPIDIIYGTLDALVIGKNIKTLGAANLNVKAKAVVAGHEVQGLFVGAVARTIMLIQKEASES